MEIRDARRISTYLGTYSEYLRRTSWNTLEIHVSCMYPIRILSGVVEIHVFRMYLICISSGEVGIHVFHGQSMSTGTHLSHRHISEGTRIPWTYPSGTRFPWTGPWVHEPHIHLPLDACIALALCHRIHDHIDCSPFQCYSSDARLT